MMQSQHPCLQCMLDQGTRTAHRLLGDGPEFRSVELALQTLVDQQPPEGPPPAFYKEVYGLVAQAVEEPDPFRGIKQENTKSALQIYPRLKTLVAQADDPLETAVRIAIAGNIIDHGINKDFDAELELQKTLAAEIKVMDYAQFKSSIDISSEILYLGDNAGETVYDRVLIETIGKPTVFTVRSKPIINDAILEDAVQAGLDKVARLLPTGSGMPGIILEEASDEFLHTFENAEIVISKGMGNFETLSDVQRPIFFMLKAKCELVAEHIGVQVGDSVLFASNFDR